MKFVIIVMLSEKDLENDEVFMDDMIIGNSAEDDKPLCFNTLDEADEYREEHTIDGKTIELPLY